MALEKRVKTVLFHDGPFDETDRFLLRSPATDYIENLHFGRSGSLGKRAGNELLSTVPNASGTPFLLHSIGDAIHALTEDGARSYVNSAWAETDVAGFVGTKSMSVETPPVGGMGHIDILPTYVSGDLYYTVVYEVREKSSSSDASGAAIATPKHVMVQSYDSSGGFLFQRRIENARSPKVVPHADPGFRSSGACEVFYQKTDTDRVEGRLWIPNIGGPLLDVGADPLVTPSWTYGMESIANKGWGHPMWLTRSGAGAEGHARYHVATDTVNNQYVFIWQKNGTIFARITNPLMTTGVFQTLLTATGPGDDTIMGEAFDCIAHNGELFFLWAEFTTTSPAFLSAVQFAKWNGSLDIERYKHSVIGVTKETHCHGGLCADPDSNDIAWMIHSSGSASYEPDATAYDPDKVRDPGTGIRYNIAPANTGISAALTKQCIHHRMASRPLFHQGKLYCAVQQWHDMTHYSPTWNAYNAWTATHGNRKPKTTVLANFDLSANAVRPVAYVDAGQSKTGEYASSEIETHIPRMFLDDNEFVMANRLVVRGEDMSCWIGVSPGSFTKDVRLSNADAPSEASCRIHRIRKGASSTKPMHASRLGDGIAVGAAIPLWYDGKFFGEFGPIDAPEIIWVTDSRLDETSKFPAQGYGSGAEGTNRWRKIQIVVGYYDSKGNKHRSEPSSIYYVNQIQPLDADPSGGGWNWVGKNVTLYYTWPLSMLPADLEYFIETYASDDEDGDPQLVDTGTITLDEAPTSAETTKVSFQLIRWIGGASGLGDHGNPPRGSETIYTAGGELPASPWPTFSESVVTSTRFWLSTL